MSKLKKYFNSNVYFLVLILAVFGCFNNSEREIIPINKKEKKITNISKVRVQLPDKMIDRKSSFPEYFMRHYDLYKEAELSKNIRGEQFCLCMSGLHQLKLSHNYNVKVSLLLSMFGKPNFYSDPEIEGQELWLYKSTKNKDLKFSVFLVTVEKGYAIVEGSNYYSEKDFKINNWKAFNH